MLAIAQLAVGDARTPNGSAFAISATAALTARHCIYDKDTRSAPLHFVLSDGQTLPASWLDDDERSDVALLALDEPLPKGWEPVALFNASECGRRTPFLVRGYPAQRPFNDADQMDGHIVDAAATAFGGIPVVALFSPQVAAPVPRDPHGFSGAPVLVALGRDCSDLAIGLIRWGEVDPVTTLVRAGSVLAAPLAPLSERWPQVADALAKVTPHLVAPLAAEGAIRSFEAQYLGRPEHPVPFGGRARELEQINRCVDAGDRPRLLLVAPAGTGKSALLLRWRQQAEAASVYVPISSRYDLAREVQVLRALAAQLAAAHGETVRENDPNALRDLVVALLKRPAQERLVVVIDGLDETEGWAAGPALLGGPLGERVSIVAAARSTASRPDAAAWIRAFGWDARDTETLTLTGLDRVGVADVLASAGQPVQRLAADSAVVDRLTSLTAGDPLVLAYYLTDLQRLRNDELDTAIAELPSEPVGLDEVFGSWWDGQRRLWTARGDEPGRSVWSTLDVLACARGPLRRGELIGITDLDLDVLDDTLRSLDRFVVQSPDGGFALAHPRLADHRRRRLAEAGALDRPQRALLAWCKSVLHAVLRGEPEQASPYAVQHLGDHLEQAGAGADQLTALVDPTWQAAWEQVADDFSGFARDVARAQAAAGREAATQIAAGEPSWAAAAAVRCAIVGTAVADVKVLLSGELALQLVRHGVWSERRAVEAVLALGKIGSMVEGLRSLAPVLSGRSLTAALERLMAVDPVGWQATHGEAMGALAARRAELDGPRAAAATVAGMPTGTGAAVALLTLLHVRPETADAGAMSLLIAELTDIAHKRNRIDVDDVLRRLADSVRVEAVAASLTGQATDYGAAIKLARACLYERDRGPGKHLFPDALGVVAPWLPSEQRDSALAQVVDDVAEVRRRDRDGNAVPVELSRGISSEADYLAFFTAGQLGPIARRLSPALAARAVAVAVSRFTPGCQNLASVIVTLAERLPEPERASALAPVLADLRRLLCGSGDEREISVIAGGLGRCGHAADVFRAAGTDSGRTDEWHRALKHAAPYLPKGSIADALALTSRLTELYRPWVAAPVLARLASFGPTDAASALRWATTPVDGREHAAAEALRTAERIDAELCEPLDPEPASDPGTRARVLRLLTPDPNEPQHDHSAIQAVRDLLKALDAASALDVARAVEGIRSVSSRNDLRGPVAVRLARLGALDAALDATVDPYVSSGPLLAILRVTPEDRLDSWLAHVQRQYSGSILAGARAELMQAVARRIAACHRPHGWALLDAWLRRPATRLERLCDLLGYAPAIWASAGADATRALADWLEPPDSRA